MNHPEGIGDELRDDEQMRRKARRDWLKHHTACAGVARERARTLRTSEDAEDAALVFTTHAGRYELRAYVLQVHAESEAA